MQLQQFDMPGTRYLLREIRTLFPFLARTLTSDVGASSRAWFSKNQKTDRSNVHGSTATLNEAGVSSRTLGFWFCWHVFPANSYELQRGHAELPDSPRPDSYRSHRVHAAISRSSGSFYLADSVQIRARFFLSNHRPSIRWAVIVPPAKRLFESLVFFT